MLRVSPREDKKNNNDLFLCYRTKINPKTDNIIVLTRRNDPCWIVFNYIIMGLITGLFLLYCDSILLALFHIFMVRAPSASSIHLIKAGRIIMYTVGLIRDYNLKFLVSSNWTKHVRAGRDYKLCTKKST